MVLNVVSGLMSPNVQVCGLEDFGLSLVATCNDHFLIKKVMYKCIMCVFENWCVLVSPVYLEGTL
jgi:hypothetical protein